MGSNNGEMTWTQFMVIHVVCNRDVEVRNRKITVGTAIFVQGNYERTMEWHLFRIHKITWCGNSLSIQ